MKTKIEESILLLLDNGVDLVKQHKHLYKNGENKYTILFFTDKAEFSKNIPEENFDMAEDAVTRWVELTGLSEPVMEKKKKK